MPEKDESICVHRTRHGIVAYQSLATLARDWTLAPTPTQFIPFGKRHSSRPDSPAPHPNPKLTSKGQGSMPFLMSRAVGGNP